MNEQEQYKQKIREKPQLDYSMPNCSVSSINANVTETRLAKILETICENCQQYMNLSALAVI